MTEPGFEAATGPLRRELTAHCYRMLGSWDEAEDAVQEAYLRAWRSWDQFHHRSSVRPWLYRIATNVTLTALKSRPQLGSSDGAEPAIQPYAEDRDDVRLALIAGLRTLTPGQRAVLLLRDVLAFPASEVGQMLDLTPGAVKSALQRARARLGAAAHRPDDVAEPAGPAARRQLDAYLTAFRTADITGLTAMLRRDARLEMIPGDRFDGIENCLPVFAAAVGEPGDWRMEPVVANGQPAAVVHHKGEPMGVAVLDCRVDGIAAVSVFGDPGLVARFRR